MDRRHVGGTERLTPFMAANRKLHDSQMVFLGYRAYLNEQEKRFYDELRAGLSVRKKRFDIRKADKTVFDQGLNLVQLDLPELYEVDSVVYEFSTSNPFITVIPTYRPSGGSAERTAIETQRKKIVSLITEKTDWERMLKLHDILCRNITYRNIGPDAHSIVGPLLRRASVCEGIAKTVKHICDALKIPCYVVTGTARSSIDERGNGPHAWNKVLLAGQWVNIDVTFDLTISKEKLIRHDYFAVPDKVISRDHSEDRKTHPCTARNVDYYSRRGLIMRDLNIVFEEVKRHLCLGGNCSFEFRFPYDINGIEQSNILDSLKRAYEACRKSGSCSISFNPETRSCLLKLS